MFEKLFKNKSTSYFVTIGIAFLALVTAIFFIATQEGNMGNYAAGVGPQTIGVFLLAGFFVELVALFLPQYRFIHVIALLMYGLAFYKETILMPDFIAGKVNNVEYNGGSFGLNLFYFIMLLIIVVASVVVAFKGFYKDPKQEDEEMALNVKDKPQVIRVGTGAIIALAAVLVGCLVSKSIVDNSAANTDPLITSAVRKAAKDVGYKYKPGSVLIKEREKVLNDSNELVYDYSTEEWNSIKNYPTNGDLPYEDAQLVYRFEGSYSEGYQGDYSPTHAYLYLWDNGTFTGEAGTTNQGKIRGFWYNSSLSSGYDAKGNDIKDCLNMVSQVNRYESIICQKGSGFYQWQAYLYLRMSWNGDRSIIVGGYEYYPNCALVVDTSGTETNTNVGADFDLSFWQAHRVITNLTRTPVLIPTEVDWYIDDGGYYDLDNNEAPFEKQDIKSGNNTIGVKYVTSKGTITVDYVDGDKNRGISQITANFTEVGKQRVVARWTKIVEKTDENKQKYKEIEFDYSAFATVTVGEELPEEE